LRQQSTPQRSGWHKRHWRGAYVPAPAPGAQRVVVKAQVITPRMSGHRSFKAALRQHLDYVQREGVALGGDAGQLYTREAFGVEPTPFLGRSAEDPHQFRIIVSPERGDELDLTRFTRALMTQVEADVRTRLDWVAVNHYDTDHPHTHILVRGVDAEGQTLALQRGYLAQGMRYRAQEIATRELGYRLDHNPRREAGRDLERAAPGRGPDLEW
jgi:type IV secretory pathway VirD2 relaxase